VVNQDFYLENNCIVLTEAFLKRRGFCCKNSCRHCPYEKDLKLKTKYILKTNNDLQFDFFSGNMISIVEGDWNSDKQPIWHGSHFINRKVEDLDKEPIPFWIDIDNVPYLIGEVTKINEV
jgi:uncharacterized protein DUF5522